MEKIILDKQNGLYKAGVAINRKMLSEIAINEPKAFTELVKVAKDALEGKMPKEVKAEVKHNLKNKPCRDHLGIEYPSVTEMCKQYKIDPRTYTSRRRRVRIVIRQN